MNRHGIVFVVLTLLSPLAESGPTMYVPTGEANEIVIIDLATDTLVGRIEGLENAHGLSASPKAGYLVAGSMQPLQKDKQAGTQQPPAGADESEHAAHHRGTGADMPPGGNSHLSIVQPETGQVVRRIAVRGLTHHTAVSPDGRFAVAVHSGLGGISIIDLARMSVLTAIDTGPRANYAVFSRDGDRLYVSNAGTDSVTELDTRSWKRLRELSAGKGPAHMVMGPRGRRLYSANTGDASVSVIDIASGNILKTYGVGRKPHGIDVSADGRWLFVSSKRDETISRIDLSNDEQKTSGLAPKPYHLAYLDKLNKLYVSSRAEPIIWVIDPLTLKTIKVISLQRGVAHQMVIRDD